MVISIKEFEQSLQTYFDKIDEGLNILIERGKDKIYKPTAFRSSKAEPSFLHVQKPITSDEVVADKENIRLSVILSTYNQPDWLEKVLWGYEAQTDKRFEVIIADDGSNENTLKRINDLRPLLSYSIKHVWHKDDGFRKCEILNKAILVATSSYLLFSDGDCIPRMDFVSEHLKFRAKNRFLSGSYFKLPLTISDEITKEDILSGRCFNIQWLKSKGLKSSFKNNKLTSFGLKEKLLNFLTTAKPTWNGNNSSAWYSDIITANGFNECMEYGGEDREFGERLENKGIKGKQIRYSAICLHLEHSRGYKNKEVIKKNNEIRKRTRKNKLTRTPYGINKE
jgi:glycosyltransferase involved in cell wall biosynthesis